MIRLFAGLVVLSSVLASYAVETVKINGYEAHPTRVLARFKAKPDYAKLQASSNIAVKRTYSEIPGLAVLELKDQAGLKAAIGANPDPAAALQRTIKELDATGLFRYVEPDYVHYLNAIPTDLAFGDGRLWGLRNVGQQGGLAGSDINVVAAWDQTKGSSNVVVAVIDTGINYTHRDLVNNLWVNPTETPANGVDDDGDGYVDNVYGINGILDTGDPADDHGHGSHVSGTIGAEANNGFDHVGVAWAVRIMSLKAFDSNGRGFTSAEIACINFSVARKVKISSNSWGGAGYSQALYDAVDAGRAIGQLFIAAAGNFQLDNDRTPFFPASFDLDNVISVAALDRFNKKADFSHWGATSVDIGAPGVEIFSCWIGSDTAYLTIDGTSMATPHVSGAAALILAKYPTFDYVRMRDRILQRTTPVADLRGITTTGGRLDVLKAITGDPDGNLEISVVPPSGSYFLTNTVTNVYVTVTDDLLVNNATVTGRFNNQTINFSNSGTGVDINATDAVYTARVTMPVVPGTYSLDLTISAPGKFTTNMVVFYDVLRPPSNDDFARAEKFAPQGGIKAGDNRLASTEPGEPLHGGVSNARSLWWSWSPASTTEVLVDTAGTTFDDDAVLAIYTGSSVSNLTEVASALGTTNGPAGTRAPFIKYTASASVTYYFAVAQTATGTNSPGRVTIRVAPNGEIDTTPPTLRVTNMLSGVFIRSTNNSIRLSGVANDPPPNASGIKDTGDGIQYRINNDFLFQTAIGSSNWITNPILLNPGWNYIDFIAFDRADNQSAVVQFTAFYEPQTLNNDLFGNASSITGASGTIVGDSSTATKEFGEPNHAGNEGGHSLWWTFVPPSDGILLLSTEGSSFDTLLGLYTVNDPTVDRSVSSVILIDSNDDSPDSPTHASELSHTVQKGKLYYIAVDGYGGQAGTVNLTYNFAAIPITSLTTSAGPGGTITPPSGDFPTGSAVTVQAFPDRYKQFSRFEITGSGQPPEVTQNPYTFEIFDATTVRAIFGPKQFAADFETNGLTQLPFQNPGNFWTTAVVVTNQTTGASSAVATVKPFPDFKDGNTASLILDTYLAAGQGSFEFAINTEVDFDKFQFLIDDRSVGTWTGEVPWTLFTFTIPEKAPGVKTKLEWRYAKDVAVTVPNEYVRIDNIDVRVVEPPPPAPATIGISATPPTLTVRGTPGATYRLETSTDLVNWSAAPGVNEQTANSSGDATFSLPAFGSARRFYRVVQL